MKIFQNLLIEPKNRGPFRNFSLHQKTPTHNFWKKPSHPLPGFSTRVNLFLGWIFVETSFVTLQPLKQTQPVSWNSIGASKTRQNFFPTQLDLTLDNPEKELKYFTRFEKLDN